MEIRIWPRQPGEKGGVLLMPLKKNVPAPRQDWRLTKCPKCGCECWTSDEHEELVRTQGVRLLCTECGLRTKA